MGIIRATQAQIESLGLNASDYDAGDEVTKEIREIMAQLAMGKIDVDRARELAKRFVFDPRFVKGEIEHFKATIKHRIGRCMVAHYVSRKRHIWEVYWDGKLIGSGNSDIEAFYNARKDRPQPAQKVQGEIIAYRGWGLTGDILTPATRPHDLRTWDGPVALTDFGPEPHGSNGLYAAKLKYAQALVDSYGMPVHGIVGLLGKVIEHERGYRAERQVVRVLRVVPPVGDGLLKLLEDRYQCQVFRFSGEKKWDPDKW